MTLRTKVTAILLALFGGYAAFSFALQQFVIYPRFVELEREEAAKNVDRTVQALQRELDLLLPSATIWGTWDDTYQCAQERDQGLIEGHLNEAALEGLAVNALGIFDARGRLLWGMAYDLEAGARIEMPGLLPPQLQQDHVLLSLMADMGDLAGLVEGFDGPLVLAARPAPAIAAELADPTLVGQRRGDMEPFLALAGTELAELVRRTGRDLEGIQTNVDHIQQILADQQRSSRAERVIEPVALAPLVRESAGMLPEALAKGMPVDLAPGLERVGRVSAARVALPQVIGNLLINAAEAIAARGEGASPGRIRVSADETVIEGQPVVHLRVADNGIGIPAEDLARIFARGYSTESRGSGMGLHWSANIIQLFGGRLFAESDGPGQGACLNLLLPQAVASQQVLQEAA